MSDPWKPEGRSALRLRTVNTWHKWKPSNWRWRLADLVNRLPGQCWTDLVTWALDGNREAIERADSWRGALPWSSNKGCGPGSPDYERNGCCYCGKLMTPELRAQVERAAEVSR